MVVVFFLLLNDAGSCFSLPTGGNPTLCHISLMLCSTLGLSANSITGLRVYQYPRIHHPVGV